MHVEWQGDHKTLGDSVKREFEGELSKPGFDASKFLVEVRREPDVGGAGGSQAIKYDVFITDVAHPERDTLSLHGVSSENWIEQLRVALRRR